MKFFTKSAVGLLFLFLLAGNSFLKAQTLTITAPNASTVWCSGSTQNITWTSSGVATLRIEGSPDGINYGPLVFAPVNAAAGTYSYTIPNNFPTGNQYRVRLIDNANPNIVSTSDAFSLTAATAINSQPGSQIACLGETVNLSVGAAGGNLRYQWKKDGVNITGATNSTYSFSAVQGVAGSYTVAINGDCGNITSMAAVITLSRAPSIATNPVSQTATVGGSVTFTVSANDATSYQWRKNGITINNNTSTLTLTNLQTSDAGDYDVTVTNSCGTVTSTTAKLTVKAAGIGAVLIVDEKLDFGTIQPGGSLEKTILVRNTGDSVLKVTAVMIGGTDAQSFIITSGNAPFEVAPNASREIKIKFFGSNVGNYSGTVSFTSNANFPSTVALSGKIGAAGGAVLTVPSALDFGAVKPAESSDKTLVITNTGSSVLNVTGITITGANASNFTVTTGNAPFSIAVGATHTTTLRFTGTALGNYVATATFASNAATASTVALTGVVSNGSKLTIAGVLNFGQTLLNNKSTKTVKITNSSSSAIMISSAVIEGTNASLFKLAVPFTPVTVNAGQSIDIAVEFLPTAEVTAAATLRITAADGQMTTQLSGLGVKVLSVEDLSAFVSSMQVRPNPATERAIVSATFAKPMMIEVQVMDMAGRVIRTLQPMKLMAEGNYSFVWDRMSDNGMESSIGVYRVVFRSANGIISLPVVIVE